jgi:N-acetylglucosamine-6-sulfatase
MEANYRERMESLLAVDDLVAKVIRELRAQGELSKTYIIYTSDNGWYWGEHRLTRKVFPYEKGARMPLIVRGPGVAPGRTPNHLLGMHDLAPTIAELAGAAPPANVDGKSFRPLLSSNSPPTPADWRRNLLIESRWPPAYQVLRARGGYYYGEWSNTNEKEFYDLSTDPYQLSSAHNTAPKGLMSELASRLSALRSCAGSQCRSAEGS